MKIRVLGVSVALLAMASVPALAASADTSSLNDFRVHGFSGCLAQEPSGVHYFDLKNAKSDDGKSLGTVRLTSSVWGVRPKKVLSQELHVNGIHYARQSDDPQGGHIRVKDAAVIAPKCS